MTTPSAAGRAALLGFEAFSPPGSPVGPASSSVPGARAADFPAEAVALGLASAGLPPPPVAAESR